jgi:hypothetical protein
MYQLHKYYRKTETASMFCSPYEYNNQSDSK